MDVVYERLRTTWRQDGIVVIRQRRLMTGGLAAFTLVTLAVAAWALVAPDPAVGILVSRAAGLFLAVSGLQMAWLVARGLIRPLPVVRLDRLGLTPASLPTLEWPEVEGVTVRRPQGVRVVEVRVSPAWRARVSHRLSRWDRLGLLLAGPGRVWLPNGSPLPPEDLRRLILWARDDAPGRPPVQGGVPKRLRREAQPWPERPAGEAGKSGKFSLALGGEAAEHAETWPIR